MTNTPTAPSASEADLAFARLHLRMGLLALARAELEALAARDALDDEAMVDLAEARWRTDDLAAAGDAARAHLDSGGHQLVAYVVAAEAVAAAGRPAEARRLVGRALELSDQPLDGVFAGMPRSVIWPTDRVADVEHAGTLFDVHPPDSVPAGPGFARAGPAAAPGAGPPAGDPSLWDAKPSPADATTLPHAHAQLDAARAALGAGNLDAAAVGLAIVLRAAPALAPAVLGVVDAAPAGEHASLELVRGDAYRLVGHETEARQAFGAAAAALGRSSTRPSPSSPSTSAAAGAVEPPAEADDPPGDAPSSQTKQEES